MLKTPDKYPIERELERLLGEIRLLLRKGGRFFFEIPSDTGERMIYVIETLAWLLLTTVIVWRLFGRRW